MITTFLLKEIKNDAFVDTSVLCVNPTGFVYQEDIFSNLRSAVEWASLNDEDVIYCVCGNNFRADFKMEYLIEIINDLANEEIFSIYIDACYEDYIPINKDLITISEIKSVTSFFLLKPVYGFVLSLLNGRLYTPEMTFIEFIQLIITNSFLLVQNEATLAGQNKIHIISPFRNAVNYLDNYFNSISAQEFKNYRVTLIDDFSNDGSKDRIPELPFIKKFVNSERKYALTNILDFLVFSKDIDDEDIICVIDADDMLPHKYTLTIINQIYLKKSVLLTYGTMLYIGTSIKIGKPYSRSEFKNLRNSPWKFLPLRTFKYKVFKALLNLDGNLNCFRDNDGNIFKMPADMALFFPIMELAGYDNIQFIDTPTYIYRLHLNNDHYINREEQYNGEMRVRNMSSFSCVF